MLLYGYISFLKKILCINFNLKENSIANRINDLSSSSLSNNTLELSAISNQDYTIITLDSIVYNINLIINLN